MCEQEMEHISSAHLERYESILNQIDSEFKKHELLKKEVDNEANKLIAMRVATEETFARENVFRVLVKIFSSIFEVFYVYSDEIPQTELELLCRLVNCKFYLVEVYVSKLFLQKVISQKWLLNICVKNERACVTKNVLINKRHEGSRILVVVPFCNSTEPSTVSTALFMHFGNFWSALRISKVDIDISYHFASQESRSISSNSDPIVKIARNYHTNLSSLLKTPTLEYNFKCKCSPKHFFESVVKNCYHRLNPQVFSIFANEAANAITVNFVIENECNAVIKLDKTENVLSIVCNIEVLHRIKKYFIGEIRCQRVFVDKVWLVALTNMKQYLQAELSEPEPNPDNLKIIYEEFRKLIFDLAV